jgi:hypothetical protein
LLLCDSTKGEQTKSYIGSSFFVPARERLCPGQDGAGVIADLPDLEEGFHTAVMIGGLGER